MTWGTDLSHLPWDLNAAFPFEKVTFNLFSYIDFTELPLNLVSVHGLLVSY